MAKRILQSNEARIALQRGVDTLANAVCVTLGPKGRMVAIRKHVPLFTLDGVTVAKDIQLKDPVEQLGAELVQEVAGRTDKIAGDGTTTATLLTQEMLREGMKAIAAGMDVAALREGMAAATAVALEALKQQAVPADTRERMVEIARISSRSDSIAESIADVFSKVGKDGIVTVEGANVADIEAYSAVGLSFDRGFVTPHFVTNQERGEVELLNPVVLVTAQTISLNTEIVPILEQLVKRGSKDVLIVAEDIKGEALATLVVNKARGALNVAAVKAPGIGNYKLAQLEDIAAVTGATYIAEELSRRVEHATIEMLGRAERIIVTKDATLIVGGHGNEKVIADRVASIRYDIEHTESEYVRDQLEQRLGRLTGGVAVLKVGAPTEAEQLEKRYRVEDAVRAVRSALFEGIVPGGGVAYLNAAQKVHDATPSDAELDERTGHDIVKRALAAPIMRIAENCGESKDIVIDRISKEPRGSFGYNGATGEYGDLLAMGVVDPLRVCRVAVEQASSLVRMFLATEAVVVEEPEEKRK